MIFQLAEQLYHVPNLYNNLLEHVVIPGPDCWDRAQARPALGGGFPFLLFRFARRVHSPTMAYVSRGPPIIPDGQFSRVRLETSAFLP